jgi:hypothetical protein
MVKFSCFLNILFVEKPMKKIAACAGNNTAVLPSVQKYSNNLLIYGAF